jgi:hypothetical protein
MSEAIAYLTRTLQNDVLRSKEILAKWRARFDNNPTVAFGSSDDAMEAAANLAIFNSVLAELDKSPTAATIETLRENIREQIFNAARYGIGRSSSASSNTMERASLSKTAAVLQRLDFAAASVERETFEATLALPEWDQGSTPRTYSLTVNGKTVATIAPASKSSKYFVLAVNGTPDGRFDDVKTAMRVGLNRVKAALFETQSRKPT